MILTFCLFTLLVATNTGAQRIKGGRRIIQEPAVIQETPEPHIHVGKGGRGGAALHHTAVVSDPVSLNPVVVEQFTPLGTSGGVKTSGLGGLGLGASSAQFSLADSQISSFGPQRLYRAGQSQVPFGLSGLDYYSYPASLLNRRNLRRKTIVSDNVSGLSPIGFGRKSAIIADPTTSQFSVGDAQIRSFGGRGLYRTGLSPVPYGLSGLDYYSYPRQLLTQRRVIGDGFGQSRILSGGGFTAGDSQVRGLVADPIGQERVSIVESSPSFGGPAIVQAAQEVIQPEQVVIGDGGFGQRQVAVVKSAGGFGGLRGGQIILRGGQGLGGLRRVKSRPIIQAPAPVEDIQVLVDANSGLGPHFGGFGQRQVAVTKSVAAPAPAPVFATQVRPQVISRGLGESFLTQAVRPVIAARRVATLGRPVANFAVSQPRVAVVQQAPRFAVPGNIQFTLGNTQIIGGQGISSAPVFAAPQPVAFQRPVAAVQRPVYAVQRPAVAVQRPVIAVQRPTFAVQRPVVAVQRPVVAVQRPVFSVKQPQVISQVKTSGFGGRRAFGRQFPQMVYVDGGSRFPGIDNIGGYRIGDPRHNYAQLPISTQRFANLGLNQAHISAFSSLDGQGSIDAGPVLVAPAPSIFSSKTTPIVSTGGIGFAGVGKTSPSKVVTQEEVIGPAGDRQVITTVTNAGPSKIGGQAIGGPLGLTAVGQTGATKTITQEEVIGLAGDRQVVTTVSQSAPSKIGGSVVASPFGLSGVGQSAPTQVVTQEEVIGPAGDSQILTTVTKTSPSKIGGPVIGGSLGGIGQVSSAQVVTQEEVIGPAGDRQVVTTVTNAAPSKIGGPVIAGPSGFTGIGQTGATKTITQEEVIGPAGDSQIVTTVTKSAPSKIGGSVLSSPLGLTAVGHTSPSKVITQEEVIGPAGDTQLVTTVTETASGPSKIGGAAISSPFASIAQAPTQVITQEEVVGPAGNTQVITTVSESSPSNIVQQEEVVGLNTVSALTSSPFSQEIAQDPIETALSQETLGDSIISSGSSLLSPIGQSTIDTLGAGQTQFSVDDVIAQSPFGGSISGGSISGGSIVSQESISGFSDPVVQESISSGFDGGLGYVPRVSFLSNYPYDVPNRAILRQALTRPIVQEQQQVEQFLV